MSEPDNPNDSKDLVGFTRPLDKLKNRVSFLIDLFSAPVTFFSALWLRFVRSIDIKRKPLTRAIFNRVGIFPVRDHFYEPLFLPRQLSHPLNSGRSLPGLDLNIQGQLTLLEELHYGEELSRFPKDRTNQKEPFLNNSYFADADMGYLYSLVRHFKPRRIIEVGSGMSTLTSLAAVKQNQAEDPRYECDLVCIEPYLQPWLEELGVEVVRKRVEDCERDLFKQLNANDILFIDSSHMIRPQGDVVFLYLEILPLLNRGVLVHSHDIFTPNDYPFEWLSNHVLLWNEQYLLEAFLTCNSAFRVMASVNHLHKNHFILLREKLHITQKESRPSSFWIVKT